MEFQEFVEFERKNRSDSNRCDLTGSGLWWITSRDPGGFTSPQILDLLYPLIVF
jgi:hypothetical protein